ncbi:MAG: hypothetical protein K6A74_08345 [Lachnospiraceae bacterium]|nr:hypothetical protein [Lachnospiraceae bacterium]
MSRFLGRTKKALAGLLAVLMVITSLPANAYAYGDVSDNSAVIDEETNAENTYDDIFIGGLDDVTGDDISDGDISNGDISNGEDPVPPEPPKEIKVYLSIDAENSYYAGYATDIHLKQYTIEDGVKKYVGEEFSVGASRSSQKGSEITILSGNGLEVTDIDYQEVFQKNGINAKDIFFYEVKSGDNTFYTTLGNPFDLGCFSEETKVFIQGLAYTGYHEEKRIERSNADIESGKINFPFNYADIDWRQDTCLFHNRKDKIEFDICIDNSGKTIKKYDLTGTFSYKVGDKDPVSVATGDITEVTKGKKYTVKIPTVAVAEGLFNGITIIPGVKAIGDNDKQLEIMEEDYTTKTRITVDGVPLKAENSSGADLLNLRAYQQVTVPAGKNVEVTVTPDEGYELKAVYVIRQDDYDEKFAELRETYSYYEVDSRIHKWIAEESKKGKDGKVFATYDELNKDGVITFKFKPEDHYYIYNDTEGLVSFEVNGKRVKNGETITVPYGNDASISVKKGDFMLNVSGQKLIAQIGEETPFSLYASGSTAYFKSKEYMGKDVILSYYENVEDAEPKASITVSVQNKITTSDISFNDSEATLNIGTKASFDLILGDGFFTSGLRDRVDVRFSKETDVIKTSADFDPVKKTASVTVESLVTGKIAGNITYLLTCKDLKIELYDKDNNALITAIPLDFVNTALENSDISGIAVTAGADTLTFDFSKTEGFDKDIDGLYYYVKGSVSGNDKSDQLWDTFETSIPVSKESSTIVLAKSTDSLEEKAIEYKISFMLVQSTSTMYSESSSVAVGSSTEKSATTVPNNLYATGISFKANKKAGKIYTNSGTVELGTVSYKADKKAITRVASIIIKNAGGKTVTGYSFSGNYKMGIWEEDNKIFFDPSSVNQYIKMFTPGKYTIDIYAMQPKGGELKCSTSITILQGIEKVGITLPRVAVKTKKALTVKAELTVGPDTDKKNLPPKTAKWCFVEPLNASSYETGSSSEPFEKKWKVVDYGKDIKIDNSGKITVAKNYKIPDGYLQLFVCARAADVEGNTAHAVESIYITSNDETLTGVSIYGPSYDELALKDKESYYSSQLYGLVIAHGALGEYGSRDVNFKYKGLKEAAKEDGTKLLADGEPVMYAPAITDKASVTVTSKAEKKNKITISFSVKSDEDLHFDLYNDQGESVLNNARKATDGSYVLISNALMGETYKLVVDGKNKSLIDHSVKTEGGKYKKVSSGEYFKAAESYGTVYSITPDSESTFIKITDKTVKDKVVKVYIVNTNILTEKSDPVTSVTASNKYVSEYNTVTNKSKITDNKGNIFNTLYFDDAEDYENAGSVNKVTYTVNIDGEPASNQTILVSTKDSPTLTGVFGSNIYTYSNGAFRIKLDEKGQFTVDYAGYRYVEKKVGPNSAVPANGNKGINPFGSYYFFDIPEGSYSFTVTPVSMFDSTAIAKPATFTFSAKPAPKASVKLKKTTYNNFVSYTKLNFGTVKNVSVSTSNGSKYICLGANSCRGLNNKGKINKFGSVFSVHEFRLVCTKSPLNYDDDYTKNPKKGMTGYVSYTWMNLDGSESTAYEKITVKPVKNGDIITEDLGN